MNNAEIVNKRLAEFHLKPLQEKTDKRFGKIVMEDFLNSFRGGGSSFYNARNDKFKKLRSFAKGKQPMKEYLDFLKIDGKESFVNIDTTPPPIAPAYIERIVQRCMERDERPTITAADPTSKGKKKRNIDEAEFRMKMGDKISELQEGAGVPLEDPNAYTPDDEDDLEMYVTFENRLPEEVNFENLMLAVWEDNGYDVLKRKWLKEICKVGIGIGKVCVKEGKIVIEVVQPEDAIYSYTRHDDFRDCTLFGEFKKVKVAEFRAMYPELGEKKVYEYYKTSNQDPKSTPIQWHERFLSDLYRPYDDATIEVMFCEVITTDENMYVSKKSETGKLNVEQVYRKPERLGENKSLTVKRTAVVYQGCMVVNTKEVVSWNRAENMIKPHQAMHEVFTSYFAVMPDQEDLENVGVTERMVYNIRQMTISLLKLQQLKSQLRPDELAVDISVLSSIDLGLGRELSPFDIQKVFQQTGILYYNGMDESEERMQRPPITPLPMSNAVNKMTALMQDYNFHLEQLRNYVGTSDVAEGQGNNPRLGLGVQNNAIGLSNRATEFVYDAFITLLGEASKRVAVLLWYQVIGNSANYQMEGDIKNAWFDISINVLPTDADKQYIEGITQTALSAGLITFEEAFKVRRIAKRNVKQAEIFLAKYEKNRQAQKLVEAQNAAAANANQQMQSNQQTHQNMLEIKQMEGGMKLQYQNAINEGDKNKQLGSFLMEMMKAKLVEGKILTPEIEQLAQMYFANLAGGQQQQIMSQEQQAQQG